jgi:hypothetical protein
MAKMCLREVFPLLCGHKEVEKKRLRHRSSSAIASCGGAFPEILFLFVRNYLNNRLAILLSSTADNKTTTELH